MAGSSAKSRKKHRTTSGADDDADPGTAKAATASEEEPQAFLARIREEKQAELAPRKGRGHGGHDDTDLAHLMRIVRALIATNGEILERCKGSQQGEGPNSYGRVIHRSIEVTSCGSGVYGLGGSPYPSYELYFQVMSTHEIRHDFRVPTITRIPEKLTSIISVLPREDDPMLPNYEKFFSTAVLLHEDILHPFLGLFKAHLEEVQVALGEVDAWLMEAKSCTSFIKDHFSVDFPERELRGCSPDCTEKHDPSAVCFNCGKHFESHTPTSSGYVDYSRHLCSNKPYGQNRASFFVSKKTCLKRVNATCEHKETFDIANDAGRTKLRKFLDYVS